MNVRPGTVRNVYGISPFQPRAEAEVEGVVEDETDQTKTRYSIEASTMNVNATGFPHPFQYHL